MRRAVPLALVALLGGCDACSALEGHVESHVDVPTTLDELEAWAGERDLRYEATRYVRPSSGGGACGHSPACVILLPVLLADALIPSTLQVGAAIEGEERVVYTGVFDLRGRLVHARVRDGDEWRVIERLPLEELGEHPIVERRRFPDGAESLARDTPLLPQVDLVAMYAAALADEGDADDRADLVFEELEVIGAELVPSVLARYRAAEPFEDEEVRALLDRNRTVPGYDDILAIVVEQGGPRSSVAAVTRLPRDFTGLAPLVPRVVPVICGDEDLEPAAEAIATLARRGFAPQIATATCPRATRTTLLRALGGQSPPDEAWVRALHEDPRPGLFLQRLGGTDPDHRRILLLALDPRRGPGREIAEALHALPPPDAAESGRVARTYATPEADADMRMTLLDWLLRADAGAQEAAAQTIERAEGTEPRVRAAALAALRRDRAQVARAVRGLDVHRVHWSTARHGFGAWNEETLVAWALLEAGCDQAQIEAGARRDAPAPQCP